MFVDEEAPVLHFKITALSHPSREIYQVCSVETFGKQPLPSIPAKSGIVGSIELHRSGGASEEGHHSREQGT